MDIDEHLPEILRQVQSEWGAGRPAFLQDIMSRWGVEVALAFTRHPAVEVLARFAPNLDAKRCGARRVGLAVERGLAPDWVILDRVWTEPGYKAPSWYRGDLRGPALYDSARAAFPPFNNILA